MNYKNTVGPIPKSLMTLSPPNTLSPNKTFPYDCAIPILLSIQELVLLHFGKSLCNVLGLDQHRLSPLPPHFVFFFKLQAAV